MNVLASLLSVFLIGHSLFGQTTPQMLEQLLQSHAPGSRVSAQIINGAPLRYNWENGATAEGENARDILPTGTIDAVILTEAQPLQEHVKWSETHAHVLKYYQLATRANPNTQVLLQETWPQGAGTRDWFAKIESEHAIWQDIVTSVNEIRDGAAPPIRLIPAGQALVHLQDSITQGAIPGLTGIQALFDDDIHLNDLGYYYVALVQYSVLTGQSPEGLPHRLSDKWGKAYAAPDAELAQQLQRAAWDAVIAAGVVTAVKPEPPSTSQLESVPATPSIGIGLAAINDWSVQQPFLNVMKTARPWIVHKPGQWGGGDHEDLETGGYLDAHGWPVQLPRDLGTVGTLILTDIPETATSLTGRYHLRFEGEGIVEVSGRAKNVRYGKGEVTFDYTPGPGPVEIRLQRSDPKRTGDYVRNISVVKSDHLDAFAAGEVFNPDWLQRMHALETFRFMDWMDTNDSTQSRWQDRPKPGDYTYARHGAPLEVMLDLIQHTGKNPWFTLPHLADDTYIRRFAEITLDALDPKTQVYVEFSNELWNWQFEQAQWADDAARERWGAENASAQYHGMRAAQTAQIWTEVFSASATPSPELVNVIATQTGWLGLEQSILEAPLWQAEPNSNNQPPWIYFDAYAVTGYFGGILGTEDRAPMVRRWLDDSLANARKMALSQGLTGSALETYIEAHRYDQATDLAAQEMRNGAITGDPTDSVSDLVGRVLPYHATVAAAHGLDLVMYEGGSHLVGVGVLIDDPELAEFFIHFNYTDAMGAFYQELISGWQAIGGQMLVAYADVQSPSKWGSWGTLRTLSDHNPRWAALVNARSCEATCD